MIKKICTIGLALGTMALSAQQMNNNGFETWSGSPLAPTSWGTVDQAVAASPYGAFFSSIHFVSQSTSPYAGTYAATLTTHSVTIPGAGTVSLPAAMVYGTMGLAGTSVSIKGTPFTYQPTSVSYAIKGTVISGDSVPTGLILTHWNTTTNKRDTVARGQDYVNSTVAGPTYAVRTYPIHYTSTEIPDTLVYLVASSVKTSSVTVGTSVTVDDIQFSGSAAGIATNKAAQINVLAYPNPAANQITISTTADNAKNVSVYDLTGRMLYKKELQNKTMVDVSTFENGMYIYVVTDANNQPLYTSKFSVSK
ncbi:MAG: T9SS type A sorting domain-containing protein [Bacteroidetes bacterium]|nr:T9SS type A sorting domain-containing protein [Bacteroidota bacterium]